MLFSKSWFALMRRNVLYRRRHWISTIMEVVLPVCFIGILIAIKNAFESSPGIRKDTVSARTPSNSDVYQTLTFADYLTAIRAEKRCIREYGNMYAISGISRWRLWTDWQVPFVKCDTSLCEFDGQDATPFCEFGILALAPSRDNDEGGKLRVQDFKNWLFDQYPILDEGADKLPFDFDLVQVFDSSRELDRYVRRTEYGQKGFPKIIMGIVWEGNDPKQYAYSLRQNSTNYNSPETAYAPETTGVLGWTTPDTSRMFNSYARDDRRESCRPTNLVPALGLLQFSCTGQYMYNGVLTIQRLVGDYILNRTGAAELGYSVAEGGVQYVQFPSEEYDPQGFFSFVEETGPVLATLGILYPVAAMIVYIVKEKHLRQKELMKMMSVTESDIGWSWFGTFFVTNVITTILTTTVSALLYEHSQFLYLLLFWFFTFLSTTVFAMMISSIFFKPSRAVLVGLLMFLIAVVVTIAIPINYREDDGNLINMISLHPVAAFTYGLQEIGRLEDQGTGLQVSTIDFTDNPSGYTFTTTIRALVFDSILWGIVTWYLNRVMRSDYGQSLPLWFPFQLSYWLPGRYNRTHATAESSETDSTSASPPIEEVGDNLKRQKGDGSSIEIFHLRKTFGDKVAVDDLCLSLYMGEVTALLGQNGAGKTTTLNILTGALPPTDGYATIQGSDIRSNIRRIRQNIGVCLQHDCLFPELTVREHLSLYSRLKGGYSGVPRTDAERHITETITDVGLSDKENSLSKHLSGGMKRKLSLAIAFCGGSKVIFLDEPTSGMDPFSRRFTWNIIRHYRQGRCIVLTTHNMNEADTLGDRIAILSKGRLRCAGSPLFLKQTFGVGYQLSIEKTKNAELAVGGGYRLPRSDTPRKASDNKTRERESQNRDIEQVSNKQTQASPKYRRVPIDPPEKEKSSRVRDNDSEMELTKHREESEVSCVNEQISPAESSVEETESALTDQEIVPDEKLIHTVTSAVEGASLISNAGSEMRFQLPMRSSSSFPVVLGILDDWVESGTVESFGVSVTTLEDVVLLLAKDDLSSAAKDLPQDQEMLPTERDLYPRSNLETRLFVRHLRALFRKRAGYFRRDRKAWFCTTILPSVFVCIGFLVFTFAAPSLDLPPLTLDLKDYNVKAPEPRNPAVFNSPDWPFRCQPQRCAYHEPRVYEPSTGEEYYFCGAASWFDDERLRCTIDESVDISGQTIESGLSPQLIDVETVYQSSQHLRTSTTSYAASLYGAILFTHDSSSQVLANQSVSYNEAAVAACSSREANYSVPCNRYAGIGYIIQYNFTALHVSPLYQSIADEALVRHSTGVEDFTILTRVAPLPVTEPEKDFEQTEVALAAWFLVVLGFPFINGAFASFVVNERQSKAKHLQTVAGVSRWAYWLSTLMWDMLNYLIPCSVVVALMFAFQIEVFTSFGRGVFPGILTLLLLYGPASAGFFYSVSFFFSNASASNMFVIVFGFLFGIGGPMTCTILTLLGNDPLRDSDNLVDIAEVLTWVLRIFPPFCLGRGLFYAINIDYYLYLEGDLLRTAWSPAILLYEVIFLAAQSVVYFTLTVQVDRWSSSPLVISWCLRITEVVNYLLRRKPVKTPDSRNTGVSPEGPEGEEPDVANEAVRVLSEEANTDSIVLRRLEKVYENGHRAVDDLSLGIPPGECFGLLGVNGAGKTTTIAMLTAEFPPTSGHAAICGFDVLSRGKGLRQCIGFCPQFDAHFVNLSGREHVELYASIKGVPKHLVQKAASLKLKEVGLKEADWDRLCSKYSGGMKRRLSLACATIGQPRVVFLDEASTGVDPVARREIWEMIRKTVTGSSIPTDERTSIVLTTHSMHECETLCSRIGIMANGRLRCLGSAQHLKHKYGQGYQVELKVRTVGKDDTDFALTRASLLLSITGREEEAKNDASRVGFNVEECQEALRQLVGDDSIAGQINEENDAAGYNIWKDASSSTGVEIDVLTVYATAELRTRRLDDFMMKYYPNHSLWERQDNKCRYEVNSDGIRISSIFARIEESKQDLLLSGYAVSQTSLEQVFNYHAALAMHQASGSTYINTEAKIEASQGDQP